MTQKDNTDQEIIDAMNKRIEELQKESLEIDFCRGEGVSLEKSSDLEVRQKEIEKDISQLKTNIKSQQP